jgi:FKBP-type peptidyl-prolyl cis-trans isomerase 2
MKRLFQAFFCLTCLSQISGCASHTASVVETGVRANLNFTCRQQNGEIAASTESEAALGQGAVKSPLFAPKVNKNPITVTPGEQVTRPESDRPLQGFEMEIISRLNEKLAGIPFGAKRRIEIASVSAEARGGEKQSISYALVRVRPKELRMNAEEYAYRFQGKPQLGQEYSYDPDLPNGVVTSVDEKEVVFSFKAQDGAHFATPFGGATVRDAGDRYEVVIDAKKGALVRLANLAGRISEVAEGSFTVDFSDPFAGEKLSCEVELSPVQSGPSAGLVPAPPADGKPE